MPRVTHCKDTVCLWERPAGERRYELRTERRFGRQEVG